MSNKRFVLLFDIEWFERVHLFKDVGMIPAYFKKIYDFDSTIIFYDNEKNRSLMKEECGINLIRIKQNFMNRVKWFRYFLSPMALYIIKNAKNIDTLMMFHLKEENFYYRLLYKLFNPNGKVYLKLDIDKFGIEMFETLKKEEQTSLNFFKYKDGFVSYLKTIKRKIRFKRIKNELSKIDVISAETKNAYNRIHATLEKNINQKFILIPNGFPDEKESSAYVKEFNEKENIILTVGRIGSFQKNSEMFLEAIKNLQLKDWKIYFIGPIEENFKKHIQEFYENNSAFKENVIFVGNINEKTKLYEWYARSKVFCLTSRYEGFPLVFPEAIYFGDYVVSTKFGADEDITKDGVLGKRIDQDDITGLTNAFQEIIDNPNELGAKYQEIMKYSRGNFVWDKILERIYSKLYENNKV